MTAELLDRVTMRGILKLLIQWKRDGKLDFHDKTILEADIIYLPEEKKKIVIDYLNKFIPKHDLEL